MRRTLAMALSALAWTGAAIGQPADDRPGQRFEVQPDSLPRPFATPSASNPPDYEAQPLDAPFRVPDGFRVNSFAAQLPHARWLAVAPDGAVFVALSAAGEVVLLRDLDADGTAEARATFAAGFQRPHGLALMGAHLYVVDVEAVWRLPYVPGAVAPGGPRERVTAAGALGDGGGHWTRNIAFGPDGGAFFVAIGSHGNIAEEPAPRATVQAFDGGGSGQRTFASGLRNPVGIAFHPESRDLYVVVNERDGLGDGLVPDYLTRLEDGGFYGWPYSYIGSNPQPGFADRRPELVARAIVPDLLFRAHSAPLGLAFYDGTQFPPEYRGDAFVALHGSWNAGRPTGYAVVRVPFKSGRPLGHYETFMTGFWIKGTDTAVVRGRPAGLAVAADGSLLVADDYAGVVWRVSYRR